MMNVRGVSVVTALLLITLSVVPQSSLSGRETANTNSSFQVDVPTWHVGDTWTYDTHLRLSMGLNMTDLHGTSTFTVKELFSLRQNGTHHEAYNVSVTGSLDGTGAASFGGVELDIEIGSALLRGFQWFDRSDLSLIRDNETINARGNVTYLIFRFPLELRFATESNRSPSQEDYDFPLMQGDRWSFIGNMRSLGFYYFSVTGTPWGDLEYLSPFDHNTTMDFDANLAQVLDIDIGGSSYHAYNVVETPPTGSTREGYSDLWYAPAVKNNVRWYLVATTVDFVMGNFINLTSYSLGADPFGLTMDLDPQIINPGGLLMVTGATSPGNTVTIRTPWNESAWSLIADPSGDYRFDIRAPVSDDHTPANTDVGSHGVIVESKSVAPEYSFNASTIVLLLPDLWVARPDLSFSSPPQVGVPTTVQAVVHVSSSVGVFNAIEAEFTVNGSFLGTDSTQTMLPGTQHTFTATWVPSAGTHTIAVQVDPRDLIIESSEGNNYAEMGASISLPDLVPWNITINDGFAVHYDNPGSVGFASPLLNASWGESLGISFSVRNEGNASFTGEARVILVETQGLRGPPIAPPFYDQTLNVSIPPGAIADAPPLNWPVPSTHSSYFFNLTVDPDRLIAETFEGNNTFAIRVSVGAPDLTIGVTGPGKIHVGGSGTATVNVRNSGDKRSPATTVEIRESAGGGHVGSIPVSPMNPSAIGALSFPLDALSASVGSVCLQFEIDEADIILESNESNNGQEWCFEVMPLPETSLVLQGPTYSGASYYYITSATDINFIGQDRSGTGLKQTQYRIDNGDWTDHIVGTPVHITAEGLHQIQYNSTDNIGGEEITKADALFVDNSAPVTTATWNGTAVAISAADNGCGLNVTYFRLDSGTFSIYDAPFSVSGEGEHTVWFYSIDRLGNIEAENFYSFTVSGDDTSVDGVAGENLKPYIAALFAVILLAAFLILWRMERKRNLLIAALAFIFAEVVTGIVSLSFDPLVYAPSSDKALGLYVDLVILVVGVAVLWVTHKNGEQRADETDSGQNVPEEKA